MSDLLEAVANSEPDPYEAMSSEDMLYKTKLANEKIRLRRERWEEKRKRNLLRENCRYEKIYERHTADRPEQEIVRAQDGDETHNQQGGAVSPEPQIVRD